MELNDIIQQLEEKHGCTVGCAMVDAGNGETIARYRENLVFKSASLIKTPIMLCALEEVERGVLSLETRITVQPCHCVAAREPVSYCGLNLVGLRRRGFTNEQVDVIHQAYRYIYQSGLNTSMAIERIKEEMEMTPEVEYIVSFVEGAKRGIIRYVD